MGGLRGSLHTAHHLFHDSCAMATSFWAQAHGPILTLLFRDTRTQHACLARVESYYESEKHAGKYLTWDEAHRERLCKGYEAFNLPLSMVAEWLASMRAQVEKPKEVLDKEAASTKQKTSSDPIHDPDEPFWHAHCSAQERELIAELTRRGILDGCGTLASSAPCMYLISATLTQADAALAHERLHALYYFSPKYRDLLAIQWNSLPRAIASAIELDLKMRGYKPSVWQDELGAYLGIRVNGTSSRRSDPSNEFGNKSAATCAEIRQVLLQQIPQCWKQDVGMDEAGVTLTRQDLECAKHAFSNA